MSTPKALGKIQGDWDFAPGQASYSQVSYRYNIFFAVIMVVLILIIVIATTSSGGKKTQDAAYFRDSINNAAELPLLRPIVVSVFERAASRHDDSDGGATASLADESNLSDQDRYNERLVVVRPNNWLIYTNNGMTFHYVTSNVSDNRLNCSASGSLTAVEYRLKKNNEVFDVSGNDDQPSRSLRFSCINYTFDQLTRVFTQSSNRTDIDMTDYFDKQSRPGAPDFTVANVLQFLVTNEYV